MAFLMKHKWTNTKRTHTKYQWSLLFIFLRFHFFNYRADAINRVRIIFTNPPIKLKT